MTMTAPRKSSQVGEPRDSKAVQETPSAFAPIGIPAVAAAAAYGSKSSIRHNEATSRELPPLLRKENLHS